jgi:tRNA threonylcarbamoyladenosine biosynthesis protein TsaB
MAIILGVETSAEGCSVALTDGDKVHQVITQTPREHTKKLLPMIESILHQQKYSLSDIDALAYSCGPGSFTGLRIGLGVVQGLAYGRDIPVIPVSTLMLLAEGAIKSRPGQSNEYFIVAIDARMQEVYWCLYKNVDGCAQAMTDECVSSPASIWADPLIARLSKDNCIPVGSGWHYPELAEKMDMSTWINQSPEAKIMMPLACKKWEAGSSIPVHEAMPVYLRDSVAWKKRKRIRQQ